MFPHLLRLPSTDPTDLFAFKISYNEVTNDLAGIIEPLYNVNISETFWKTDSDNIIRNYGYQYDALNRLTNSIYQNNNIATNSYNEELSYDKNGNIATLKRTGYLDSSTPYPIDDLFYGYANNSNSLLSVYDESQSIDGFKDGNLNGNDYAYDDFGNMNLDLNKGIQNITYNHLNLPTKIDLGSQGNISYLYNALGVKLGKTVTAHSVAQGTVVNTTDYLGGFQYQDNELQFFPTAEGYVSVVNGDKFNYVYNYTDHLGNIRVSYSLDQADQQIKILEENHYYPFGLKHSNYNNNTVHFDKDENGGIFAVIRPVERSEYQYKYQGQERQDELGLNWDSFKWRNYDYAIGRFMSIDPLAEKYPYNGTYNFSENRVIDGVELEGLEVVLLVDKGDYAKADVGHTFVVLGSGKDMTVYTYGRWAGTNENSSGSHTPLNNGSGVMVKLEGKEAMQEAQKYVDKYGAQGYEIENASESLVRTKLEDQFNSSSQTPDTGKYKGDERAHVIDNYDLTSNNCTTKSLDAVHKGVGKPIEVTTTTTAGGFPVVQKDSTESTYAPKDLNNQLNQATKDPNSGVINVTDRFKTN